MNFLKKPTLYVVEDNDATRDALHRLFVTLDVNVNTFSCAETFLELKYKNANYDRNQLPMLSLKS